MQSLKDKVAIVGMGCTKTGDLYSQDAEDFLVDACYEALADAGLEAKDIQAAWLGTRTPPGGIVGGQPLTRALKLDYLPVTRVENRCATGGDAFRNGVGFVAGGLYDIVMVAGTHKAKDDSGPRQRQSDGGGGGEGGRGVVGNEEVFLHLAPPQMFAPFATRYMHHYGVPLDKFRTAMAKLMMKSHHMGTLNPKAWLRRELTLDEALNAPWIAWPLTRTDCSGIVDGGACAIITTPEIASQLCDDYVLVKGIDIAVGGMAGRLQSGSADGDFVHFEENIRASKGAYAMAGVKDPFHEFDLAEFHDAFSIVELLAMEDMGLAPRGQGCDAILAGTYELEGELPTQTDGGLKATGHPVGATGIKMLYEIYRQIQGKCGPRQVKNARLGVAHNQGGNTGIFTTVITILGARD